MEIDVNVTNAKDIKWPDVVLGVLILINGGIVTLLALICGYDVYLELRERNIKK